MNQHTLRTYWQPVAALLLMATLSFPPLRPLLEASMTLHMLVQLPLLGLTGFLLSSAIPKHWRSRIDDWNEHGVTGLFTAALILALAMVPRLLDLALTNQHVEVAKYLALMLCGGSLRISWRSAGLLMQGFFLGNVLPMMGVVGSLYETSPTRVCNAYLLGDQARLGQLLMLLSACIAVVWITALFRTFMRS
jgi:hypothetical protein